MGYKDLVPGHYHANYHCGLELRIYKILDSNLVATILHPQRENG